MNNRIYNVNHNYFNKIDSQEKAYALGLLYSDGCVCEVPYGYIVSFVQCELNKQLVEILNSLLESEYPISIHTPDKGLTSYRIALRSKQLGEDLIRLGCTPNKSLSLTFPKIDDIYMGSFILGYFDGDGCVWDGKRKVMRVKDLTRPTGYRDRIVHNVKFTFTGNSTFIEQLLTYLCNKLGFKKTKLNYSKAKNKSNTTSETVCTMEYSGRGQLKLLYDFMYKYIENSLMVKKLKFENIFCALEEKSSKDTSLIAGTPETVISSQADGLSEGSSTIPEMGVEASASKCEAPNSAAEGEDIVSSAAK